jgi:hypothetical protein
VESLRPEVQQGNQQAAQALPAMVQATQAALQRLLEASSQERQNLLTPAAFHSQMQDCMSATQARVAAAVSSVFVRKKSDDAESTEFASGRLLLENPTSLARRTRLRWITLKERS